MSEAQASDQFAILEQKAVKYAIAVEAREAVHAYLKLWGTMFAVVTTGVGVFGFSLSKSIASLHSSAGAESRRLDVLQHKTNEMGKRLEDKEKMIDANAARIAANADQLQGHADKMTLQAAQFADAAISFNDRRLEAITQLAKAANDSKQSASEAKEHLSATTNFRNAAATASELAKAEASRLEATMRRADVFEVRLATQQRIFRDALLDYVTLTSNAESPELTLLTPFFDTYYVLQFQTPSHVTTGFTLHYNVTECHGTPREPALPCDGGRLTTHAATIESQRNRRNWHIIEGTDEQFRFAIDYVFVSGFARNFVTIRIAGTDRLFLRENLKLAAKGVDP